MLTGARYNDEPTAADPNARVTASYGYYGDVSGGAPLLAHGYDPHFPGPMWGTLYAYDNSRAAAGGWGRVAQEQNPWSGAVVTALSIPPDASGNPQHDEFGGKVRQETRGDRAEDGSGNANSLVRSFGYWPNSNFLHYVTDYVNQREVRQYDNHGYLYSVNDRRNNQTIFRNEPHVGQLKQVTLPPDQQGVSHSRKLDYSDSLYPYHVTSASEQAGPSADSASADWHTTYYDRDGLNRVWRVRYPDSGYETFTYDDSADGCGQVSVHRLASGGSVSYAYGHSAAGTRGILLSKTENDGAGWSAATTYAYDSLDRLQTVTDARGNQTLLAYNGRHQVVRVTHPQDPARQRYPDGQNGLNYTTAAYDDQGNRLSTTDECGHTNAVSYDNYRRPVLTQDALGHCVFLSYERRRKNGQVVANADTHTRGAWTTLMRPSYADGARFKHAFRAYDPFFRLVSETAGLGGTDANWPNVVSGGNAGRTDFAYDVDGNLTSTTDALGRVTSYGVDARGWRTSLTLPADGQFDRTYLYYYDGVGNLTQETRPAGGKRFFYAYDPMNRRVWSQDPADHGTQTVFTYKANPGAKLTTTDPNGNAYVLQSDGLGRPVRLDYLGGITESWHYDAAGNVDTFTNRAGQVQTMTYDNRNWATQSAWNTGGRTVYRAYYADGQLSSTATSTGSALSYGRDAAGRVTVENQSPDAGLPWTAVTSGYDDDNRRTQISYPGGDYVLERYNDRGQLGRVYLNTSQYAQFDHGYSADGRPTVRYRVNGVHTFYYFDGGGRLGTLGHTYNDTSSAANLRDWRDYGYDAQSRVNWFFKHQDGRGDRYAYGVDDQLGFVNQEAYGTNTTSPSGDLRQTNQSYDAAGNRTVSDNTQTGHIDYTNTDILNRYRTLNGASVGYDANSNLTYEPLSGSTYVYDADNRLVRAICPPTGTDRAFGYDALGRCVWRQDNGGAKSYLLYDGANLVEDRVGGYANRTKRYVHGAGADNLLLTLDANGAGLYHHQDLNGNVVAPTDSSSAVVERYHYDPFGRPLVCDGAGTENRGDASLYGNRFLFTGREWMAALKLYDYRARAYLPSLGRFLQADPIGFAGGNHLYRYCANNPVNGSDPSGLLTTGPGSFTPVQSQNGFLGSSNGVGPDRLIIGDTYPAFGANNLGNPFQGTGLEPRDNNGGNRDGGGSSGVVQGDNAQGGFDLGRDITAFAVGVAANTYGLAKGGFEILTGHFEEGFSDLLQGLLPRYGNYGGPGYGVGGIRDIPPLLGTEPITQSDVYFQTHDQQFFDITKRVATVTNHQANIQLIRSLQDYSTGIAGPFEFIYRQFATVFFAAQVITIDQLPSHQTLQRGGL